MLPEFDEQDTARDEDELSVGVPGFLSGGRVDRTGIALVHEGEYIMPAPGSEALIASGTGGLDGGPVINYYFPVEIEVIGSLSEEQIRLVADYAFSAIEAELASRL